MNSLDRSQNVDIPVDLIGNLIFDHNNLSIDICLFQHHPKLSLNVFSILNAIEIVASCMELNIEAPHLFVSSEVIKDKVLEGIEIIADENAEKKLISDYIFKRLLFRFNDNTSENEPSIAISFSALMNDNICIDKRLDIELCEIPKLLGVIPARNAIQRRYVYYDISYC
jgi:hypothetical protein